MSKNVQIIKYSHHKISVSRTILFVYTTNPTHQPRILEIFLNKMSFAQCQRLFRKLQIISISSNDQMSDAKRLLPKRAKLLSQQEIGDWPDELIIFQLSRNSYSWSRIISLRFAGKFLNKSRLYWYINCRIQSNFELKFFLFNQQLVHNKIET